MDPNSLSSAWEACVLSIGTPRPVGQTPVLVRAGLGVLVVVSGEGGVEGDGVFVVFLSKVISKTVRGRHLFVVILRHSNSISVILWW